MNSFIKNKSALPVALIAGTTLLTGCGARVEVPPAHVGKVKTSQGIEDRVYQPSSFRLPYSLMVKNQLILVETATTAQKETLEVFMPKDQLLLKFDVRGMYSISQENTDTIFTNITPISTSNGNILYVPNEKVYETYGQQIIRTKARAVLSQHTIEYVLSNLDAVSNELYDACKKELDKTPLTVHRLGLADVRPPDIILRAQETAKEREVAIKQAEAEKQIKLANAEAAREVALKQQEVDLIEAETQVLVEKKLAESVSEAFVTQRSLKALDKLASSENTIVFLPMEAMTNPSIMIGATNEAFHDK